MKATPRVIRLDGKNIILTQDFDKSILQDISWSYDKFFRSHQEIAAELQNKHPYTITVLIESLDYKLRDRNEYVKKTKFPIMSKYRQLLYEEFDKEYGDREGNRIYADWLEKYRPVWLKEKRQDIDEYIIANELEPRYKQKILSRFKDHEKLFVERFRRDRQRYYNLPEPLNRVDWRNPFDTIFVWEENGKKVARRGGSGSSGARETNSMFIFALLELNKVTPVPSYLFLYSDTNELLFIKKFDSLCVPAMDIGSNYHLESSEEEKLKEGGKFLSWDSWSVTTEIKVL